MKNDELRDPIVVVNRQNGDVVKVIEDKKTYVAVYSQLLKMNDVKTALEVWCDFTHQTKRELLRDFNLSELINTFSTRYLARPMKRRKHEAEA